MEVPSKRDVIFALLTFAIGAAVASPALKYGWNEFPSGADARGHMTKVWMLEKFWSMGDYPYPKWSEYWYCGYPFLWYYPPGVYFLSAAISKTLGSDVLTSWKWVIWFFYALAGPAVYAAARLLGVSPVGALAAGVLYQTAYNHIEITFTEGRIPTVAAVPFLALTVPLAVALFERPWRRLRYMGMLSLALAATLLMHHGSGAAAVALIGFYLLVRGINAVASAVVKDRHPELIEDLPGFLWNPVAVALGLAITAWWLYPALHYDTYSYTTKPKWWIHMSSVHEPWEVFVPCYWKTRYCKYVGAVQVALGVVGMLLGLKRKFRAFLPIALTFFIAYIVSMDHVPPLTHEMMKVGFEPKWVLMFTTPLLCAVAGIAVDAMRRKGLPWIMLAGLLVAATGADAYEGMKYAYRLIHYTKAELAGLEYVAHHAGRWDRVATIGYRAMWGMEPYITGKPAVFGWFREGTPIRTAIIKYKRAFKRNDIIDALRIGSVLGVKYLVVDAKHKPYAKWTVASLHRLGVHPVAKFKYVRVYRFRPHLGYELVDGVKSVFLGGKYSYMRFCMLADFSPKVCPAYAFTSDPSCRLVRTVHPEVVVKSHPPVRPKEVRVLKRYGVKEIIVLDRRAIGVTERVMDGVRVVKCRPIDAVKMLPKRRVKPVHVTMEHGRFRMDGSGYVWVSVPYFPLWEPDRGVRVGNISNMLLLKVPGPTWVRFEWRPSVGLWVLSCAALVISAVAAFSRRR